METFSALLALCAGNQHWQVASPHTVYPNKYAHGFVVLCFVVVMQFFIMNSHEVFIHIHQGCFAGTGAIVRLPQCQWSKPDGYGKISQCITTTKHSKAKTVCIFLGTCCKGQWCGALMFSLTCVWTNGWANNWDASDLRRHYIHYDVIVMDWFHIFVSLPVK